MASEQLKYDFELNLARAEKNVDRFVTGIETRFERVSNRMERAFEKIAKGAGSGARGGTGGGLERDVDRVVRRQAAAQREITRQQRQQEREIAADKRRFEREESQRISQRDRKRKQQQKDIERDERRRVDIVDRFEQKRRTRKESLGNISSRAELRSRGQFDRIDWQAEDEKAMSKALAARKRFVDSVQKITTEGSWKSLSTNRTEIAQQETIYKSALTRIAAKNAAMKSAGGGGFMTSGKGVGAAFQVQQMIEDYSYAGFRGLSNNLAFLGSSLGGKAGLAVIAGVAAKGLYDLTAATMGWSDAAEKAAERGKRAADVMAHVDELRRQSSDMAIDFRAPDNMADLRRREDQLRRDEQRLSVREPARSSENDLRIMTRMLELRQELKDAEATESRTKGFAFVGGVSGDRAASLRESMGLLQSKLTVPVNIDDLETIIEKRQQAYEAAIKDDSLLKDRVVTERRLIDETRQLIPIKERISELEDRVTEKLREQQRAEERLVETAKDRAKSVREQMTSSSDSFESKMLDKRSEMLEDQFEKRIERVVKWDANRQRNAFGRMFPQASEGQKGQFEQWLEQRGEAIKRQGQDELYNRQFKMAQQRAQALSARAAKEAAAGRSAFGAGDLDGGNAGFEQAIKSLEQIQELNFEMQGKGDNPARSSQWLKVIEQFQGQIAAIQNEQVQANEKFSSTHGTVNKELEATEARLKEIKKQIELMNASDEKALGPWQALNAEMDGTIKRLQQIEAMKNGGKGPAPAGGGPAAAAGGRKFNFGKDGITTSDGWRWDEKSDQWVQAGKPSAVVGQTTIKPGQKPKAKQHWQTMRPDPTAVERAQGYLPLVQQALRTKENEFLKHKDNALDRKRFQGMWNEFGEVGHKLEGPVNAEEAKQAEEQLQRLLERIKALDAIPPAKVIVDVIERHHTMVGPGGKTSSLANGPIGMPRNFRTKPKFRATGGPVSPSSPYIVGEQGRELFIPNTGGFVVNATDTRKMLSGGQRRAPDTASTTTNSFTNNFGGVTIQTANVDMQDIQRQTNWREKARRARMGN